MIKIENIEVHGWEPAIRGMRNPKNSWAKSDSEFLAEAETEMLDEDGKPVKTKVYYEALSIGPNDYELMMKLRNGGPDDRKFMRMIVVYLDITAPLYWWKEYDTYKVGTVANSCSTMHKIHAKEFEMGDFSTEHLRYTSIHLMGDTIDILNLWRDAYNKYESMPKTFTKEYTKKECWQNLIQILPTSFNQKRTVMLNYEVLTNMYHARKNHKLDEWREFCKWVKTLPYSELITKEK